MLFLQMVANATWHSLTKWILAQPLRLNVIVNYGHQGNYLFQTVNFKFLFANFQYFYLLTLFHYFCQ